MNRRVHRSDLGELVATFRAKRWPRWLTPAGVLAGAAAILFGVDGDGHVKSIGTVVIGALLIAASVIAPWFHRMVASSVDVHRDGLRFGRPGNARGIAWRDITGMVVEYRTIEVEGTPVPAHRMSIELVDGSRVVFTSVSCSDPLTMMRTVEAIARPTLETTLGDTKPSHVHVPPARQVVSAHRA